MRASYSLSGVSAPETIMARSSTSKVAPVAKTDMPPATSRADSGSVSPIPTLPAAVTKTASVISPSEESRLCPSAAALMVVPSKVMLLPAL